MTRPAARCAGASPMGDALRRGAVEALRHLAQRQLAQRREVRVAEEVLERPGDLVLRVDLARLEPLDQVLHGEVEVHDLVGLLEEAVGHRLAHRDAGVARDELVERLEVLDVERADDVDAGAERSSTSW